MESIKTNVCSINHAISKLESIFCTFLAENIFVNALILFIRARLHLNENMQRAKKSIETSTSMKKEKTMETINTFECGICFYQSKAKDFTPITVSADFAALECPNCLNNNEDTFSEIDDEIKKVV